MAGSTMTEREIKAWTYMARTGELRRHLDCDEGNGPNRQRYSRVPLIPSKYSVRLAELAMRKDLVALVGDAARERVAV